MLLMIMGIEIFEYLSRHSSSKDRMARGLGTTADVGQGEMGGSGRLYSGMSQRPGT